VSVKSQAVFGRLDAEFDSDESRETAAAVAQFVRRAAPGAHDPRPTRATLAIDPKDCIGCDVCVAHCAKGVLRMVGGKAMADLRNLDRCDLDGECVRICPTRAVSLHTEPYVPAPHEALAELTAEEAARLGGREVERALGGPIVLGPAGPGAPTPLPPSGGKAAKGVHLPILGKSPTRGQAAD
jgi:ferredoxin